MVYFSQFLGLSSYASFSWAYSCDCGQLQINRVTCSCLGPQIGLDGIAGLAGTLHVVFHCGLYHSVVFSVYQKDKNRSRQAFEVWTWKLQNITSATFYWTKQVKRQP